MSAMDIKEIESLFRSKVGQQIEIYPEGVNRFKVFTPFQFDDGDSLSIVLKRIGDKWILTDEAHTYMHLSYEIDMNSLEKGTRQKIITSVLSGYGIKDQDGELLLNVEQDDLGNAFYSYVQGLIRITDVTYLTRERVRSTFMDDFKTFLHENVAPERVKFNYTDPAHDADGKYPVDCRVNGMAKPLFIFGISNEDKCRDVTISLMWFEKHGIPHHPIAVFEDQEEINRKVLARFSDVVEKQFSSLSANRDRIKKYFSEFGVQHA
jgi:hypothetical protein